MLINIIFQTTAFQLLLSEIVKQILDSFHCDKNEKDIKLGIERELAIKSPTDSWEEKILNQLFS